MFRFANKQDLQGALSGSDIALHLALDKFMDYSYSITTSQKIQEAHVVVIDINRYCKLYGIIR